MPVLKIASNPILMSSIVHFASHPNIVHGANYKGVPSIALLVHMPHETALIGALDQTAYVTMDTGGHAPLPLGQWIHCHSNGITIPKKTCTKSAQIDKYITRPPHHWHVCSQKRGLLFFCWRSPETMGKCCQ